MRAAHMGSLDVSQFQLDSDVKMRANKAPATDEPVQPRFD